jgi:hypothetical protein
VPSLDEYDVVTVTATVIAVNEAQKVGQGKMKQEVTIADETGTCAVHPCGKKTLICYSRGRHTCSTN